jgi:hypothetical protein
MLLFLSLAKSSNGSESIFAHKQGVPWGRKEG